MGQKNYIFLVSLLISVIIISGCMFAGGEAKIIKFEKLPSICQDIITKHNFTKIRDCSEHSIFINNKEIPIIFLAFGEALDCASGCVYGKYLSSIEDGEEYTLYFYHGRYFYYSDEYEILEKKSGMRVALFEAQKDHFRLPQLSHKIYVIADYLNNTRIGWLNNAGMSIDDFIYVIFKNEDSCQNITSKKYKEKCLDKFQLKKDNDYLDSIDYKNSRDVSICYNVKTLRTRDDCIRRVAHNLKDLDLCEEITDPYTKNEMCFGAIARIHARFLKKDLALDACRKIDPNYTVRQYGENGIHDCFFGVAKSLEDSSICNEIDDESFKKLCIKFV